MNSNICILLTVLKTYSDCKSLSRYILQIDANVIPPDVYSYPLETESLNWFSRFLPPYTDSELVEVTLDYVSDIITVNSSDVELPTDNATGDSVETNVPVTEPLSIKIEVLLCKPVLPRPVPSSPELLGTEDEVWVADDNGEMQPYKCYYFNDNLKGRHLKYYIVDGAVTVVDKAWYDALPSQIDVGIHGNESHRPRETAYDLVGHYSPTLAIVDIVDRFYRDNDTFLIYKEVNEPQITFNEIKASTDRVSMQLNSLNGQVYPFCKACGTTNVLTDLKATMGELKEVICDAEKNVSSMADTNVMLNYKSNTTMAIAAQACLETITEADINAQRDTNGKVAFNNDTIPSIPITTDNANQFVDTDYVKWHDNGDGTMSPVDIQLTTAYPAEVVAFEVSNAVGKLATEVLKTSNYSDVVNMAIANGDLPKQPILMADAATKHNLGLESETIEIMVSLCVASTPNEFTNNILIQDAEAIRNGICGTPALALCLANKFLTNHLGYERIECFTCVVYKEWYDNIAIDKYDFGKFYVDGTRQFDTGLDSNGVISSLWDADIADMLEKLNVDANTFIKFEPAVKNGVRLTAESLNVPKGVVSDNHLEFVADTISKVVESAQRMQHVVNAAAGALNVTKLEFANIDEFYKTVIIEESESGKLLVINGYGTTLSNYNEDYLELTLVDLPILKPLGFIAIKYTHNSPENYEDRGLWVINLLSGEYLSWDGIFHSVYGEQFIVYELQSDGTIKMI